MTIAKLYSDVSHRVSLESLLKVLGCSTLLPKELQQGSTLALFKAIRLYNMCCTTGLWLIKLDVLELWEQESCKNILS